VEGIPIKCIAFIFLMITVFKINVGFRSKQCTVFKSVFYLIIIGDRNTFEVTQQQKEIIKDIMIGTTDLQYRIIRAICVIFK
jgi:hypothetical protein